MIIHYKIIRYNDTSTTKYCSWTKGDIQNIVFDSIEDFCCTEMEEAINEDYIIFGEMHEYILNKDANLNIVHCSPYPEGAVFCEMAIKYCPFCGKEFELKEK